MKTSLSNLFGITFLMGVMVISFGNLLIDDLFNMDSTDVLRSIVTHFGRKNIVIINIALLSISIIVYGSIHVFLDKLLWRKFKIMKVDELHVGSILADGTLCYDYYLYTNKNSRALFMAIIQPGDSIFINGKKSDAFNELFNDSVKKADSINCSVIVHKTNDNTTIKFVRNAS